MFDEDYMFTDADNSYMDGYADGGRLGVKIKRMLQDELSKINNSDQKIGFEDGFFEELG